MSDYVLVEKVEGVEGELFDGGFGEASEFFRDLGEVCGMVEVLK